MAPAINTVVLTLATILFAAFYVQSLQPARLEERIGELSYARCTACRTIASVLEVVIFFSYALFYFFPTAILRELPWQRWLYHSTSPNIGRCATVVRNRDWLPLVIPGVLFVCLDTHLLHSLSC